MSRPAGTARTLVTVAVSIALLLPGCARRKPVRIPAPPPPPTLRVGAVEVGIASWYGHPYHGRPASSGEIYDMEKLTAAHRTLPFGSRVQVQNLDNHRSVQVRINDRGPFVEGRVIDLSRAAARAVHRLGPGTARVRLEVRSLPETIPESFFAVQIGAFRERANAERLLETMKRRYGSALLQLRDGAPPLWRVLVGHESTPEAAATLAQRLRAQVRAAFVVRVEAPSPAL